MASFSAELHVAGVVIPLIRCTYSTHQSTDARGRVITKARKSPIDCEADVPEHQVLDAWAADPHKRQEAIIIFRNAATGAAWETLHLKAAYCVRYTEVFVMGDLSSGSYRCYFTLSDPDGWIWHPGGPPNEALIRPPAREHGRPPVPVAFIGADAMADLNGPWAAKKQSGKAYLGSPPLKRSQLLQLHQLAQEKYGVEIKVLKEGDELLDTMCMLNMRAGFQASSRTVFLQPQATYYEAAHELKHAEQCASLGVEAYTQQPRLDKEMYVYEQLMREKHNLTFQETTDALRYINSLRSDANLFPLTA